jgi:hypothetical protein
VNEAVAAIVAKVLRDALADVTASGPSPTPAMNTRPEEPTMDATDYITKGGTAWQLIEARAAQRVAKTAGTMTRAERAKAVSDLLATKEGAALYSRYCEEQEQVAKRHARSRLAPPDGVQ